MTYDQYWYGDATMVRAFYKADKIRQERQNNEAWLQGMYFYDALSTALYNFASSKGTKQKHYPDEPYEIGKKANTEQEKEKEIQSDRLRARAYFDSLIRSNKERLAKKGG